MGWGGGGRSWCVGVERCLGAGLRWGMVRGRGGLVWGLSGGFGSERGWGGGEGGDAAGEGAVGE